MRTGPAQPSAIEAPAVIFTQARGTAVIRITVPRSDMPRVMGPAIREVREALSRQGIPPGGSVFAHHLRMDDAVFDCEVGILIDAAVDATGRVRPGNLPAGPVARTIYSGGYNGLAAAWSALRQWTEENGYARTEDLWEVYTAGPEASQTPADWRTELNQPLRL